MADLVRGRYPVTNSLFKMTGGFVNATQSDINARSNIDWFGISGATDTALAATGVATAVAIPVEVGDVISRITILVGGTAEATGTFAFSALYSGIAVPALLAQSAALTGAASVGPASAAFTFTLATPQMVTPAVAPGGFVYASVSVTATTIPTVARVPLAAAVGYQWFTTGPLFLAATHGSGLTNTAPATIAAPTAAATAPLVFLT